MSMMADRYTKAVLTVIAVALVMIAGRAWLADGQWFKMVRPNPAQAESAVAKYEIAVPKSWGKLVGFSNNNLLLEASDQSLRIVDVEGKQPEYPKVKVLIRWQ